MKMSKGLPETLFVTGTDTGVGKTLVSCALLSTARSAGLSTAAVKPVAAGAEITEEGMRNDDALALLEQCTLDLTYDLVNPVCLKAAIAPHIAASQEGRTFTLGSLAEDCHKVLSLNAGFTCIEGAGGWAVPLNDVETLAQLPGLLGIPVILVVGIRLGCLNHALLTVEAIERSGANLYGWVASQTDPDMPEAAGNIAYLEEHISAPLLGSIPFLEDPDPLKVAEFLEI